MKLLADLLNERKKEDDVAKVIARVILPDDIAWVECKKRIRELTDDYEGAIKRAIENEPLKVKKRYITGGSVLEVEMVVNGFPACLYIAETFAKGVVVARYEAYNNKENKIYVRRLMELIDEKFPDKRG